MKLIMRLFSLLFLVIPFISISHQQYTEFNWPDSIKNLQTSLFNGFFTKNITITRSPTRKTSSRVQNAIKAAAQVGLAQLLDENEVKHFLDPNDPASKLSEFSAPVEDYENSTKLAYASLLAAKRLKTTLNLDFSGVSRERDTPPRISLRKTVLESFCPPREPPICPLATKKYRTHDGICNNLRHLRWGSAQMPFHRFLVPEYNDGIDSLRLSVTGGMLPSARFVSLVVHGDRDEDSQVTMMLPQWGQFIDHDLTATSQPKAIDGRIPSCCKPDDLHPACLPIKVPDDDPWLSPLGVKCLEFLRSAPASRRDCTLSWREQTNQASSFLDASMIYSSNPRLADNSRVFRDGLLVFGRGTNADVCRKGGVFSGCVKAGDTRSGEQPGLLTMHTVFVSEHNRIALQLSDFNPHWSDEKLFQETRRIIGAIVQHITYREFLPLVLGREVLRLFDLELRSSGYYEGYDPKTNPSIANSFSAAAFRFGHSMIQKTMMRSDKNNIFIKNNVSLHEENARGDIGGPGSLHRLIRGLVNQRAAKRDEFVSAELTNHLFQSSPFPFGLDLAAINIQRGRDHGLPPYVAWRQPCGLSPVKSWSDLNAIVGPASAQRIRLAYHNVEDIDLFVAGLAERPVSGGLVGPTFACIIAQQFSNLRKGDRFWYENFVHESAFTPAQIQSIRRTSLAQVLCRSLEGGSLQPHVFLPPTFHRNERKICGQDELEQIDLTPWTEHDPFKTDAGHEKEPLLESPFSTSNNEVSNKLDLESIDKLHTKTDPTSRPTSRPTKSRPKPTKTRTTKRPVNNKLDFTKRRGTVKRPLKTTPKTEETRKTTKLTQDTKLNDDKLTDMSTTRKKKRSKRKTKTTTTLTTNGWIVLNDTDWIVLDENRKLRSRPIGFQNNKPIYDNTDPTTTPSTTKNWYEIKTTHNPIVDWNFDTSDNKKTSNVDIDYWKKFINTMTPPTTISYDIEVPLLTSTKRWIRPNLHTDMYKTTTNKPTELQTILEKENLVYSSSTTSDPMTFFMSTTTTKPFNYYSENSQSQSGTDLDVHHVFSSSLGHLDLDPWKDSYNLISLSQTNTKTTRQPLTKPPTTTKRLTTTTTTTTTVSSVTDPDEVYYFNDRDWERLDTDHTVSNDQIKYFYVDNVLHKVEPNGVYRKRPTTKRYTEPNLVVPLIKQIVGQLDTQEQGKIGHMTDLLTTDDTDNIHWIRRIDDNVERRNLDIPLTTRQKSKKQSSAVAFVPLVLLTNVERKDNWVHVEPRSKRIPLPEMPALQPDDETSNEIPRPMRGF